ncbi:MAG: carboxypeptidase-like regulatory domain-containing protein [Flavobacteriaceae bacterium]|nr:carboxypeptidase-like regulatory domain-containing protein [Flavobacteriaceae bacterium]
MLKRIFLLGVIMLIIGQLNAQKQLSGQVVEAGTNTPIPYAMLIIKNTIYGTQSDEQGKYLLKLPKGYEKDSISVTSLSYEEKIVAVSTMTENQKIELKLNSNVLDEVVVYPIDPEDILKKAEENRDKNHKIEGESMQECFARELFFDKGKCFRVAESVLNIYNLKSPKEFEKEFEKERFVVKKMLKARGIQDSAKLWFFNDMFRMKHDTIAFDTSLSKGLSGFDITSFFEKDDEDRKTKKGKDTKVDRHFASNYKYNGTVKVRGRTTHRILFDFSYKKKVIIKGNFLVDSATYAFTQVQLANQNIDLYKEFAPWYLKMAVRLLGYKPAVNRLALMSSYAIGKNEKWYKVYDYYRFGGSLKKRRRMIDGYVETECFYEHPKAFEGNVKEFYEKNKKSKDDDFQETVVTSFDDEQFFVPFNVQNPSKKVKELVNTIQKNNEKFEGSIGYNKKESRKKRREERRKRRSRK